jgi:hypothetical protein
VALGTLTGFALKMVGVGADHTYVTSSNGHVWPCNGRSSGGSPIAVGVGNVDQSDCLAQPDLKCGIKYSQTGVCHQMANRLLFPANGTVSSAAGYRWSMFIYGTYGKDPMTGAHYSPMQFPWPELAQCQHHSHP